MGAPSTVATQSAFASVAASQTDSVLVAAKAGQKIRVDALVVNFGDTTASIVTLLTKGSGAGTAIAPPLKATPNGGFVLPPSPAGWFATNRGESLTVTTGAGSTTNIGLSYSLSP